MATMREVTHAADNSVSERVLFFDGECGLCDRLVQFVLKHDRDGLFQFASLQGSTFAKYRQDVPESKSLESMVLVQGGSIYERSDAALRVLQVLGGFWGFLGRIGLVVPRAIRDFFYNLVAKHRYRLFGRVNHCTIPNDTVRSRFLP